MYDFTSFLCYARAHNNGLQGCVSEEEFFRQNNNKNSNSLKRARSFYFFEKSKKIRENVIANHEISSDPQGLGSNGVRVLPLWHQLHFVSTRDLSSRSAFSYVFVTVSNSKLCLVIESFTRKQEYGLTLLVSTNDKVNGFLKNVLSQIQVKSCFSAKAIDRVCNLKPFLELARGEKGQQTGRGLGVDRHKGDPRALGVQCRVRKGRRQGKQQLRSQRATQREERERRQEDQAGDPRGHSTDHGQCHLSPPD